MRIKTKMSRKRSIVSLLFVGIFLFIGGVFAFNRDSISFNNLFHLGEHVATHTEEFVSPDDWQVCDETPKTLVTRNDSTHDIYVRLSYDEYWRMQDDITELPLIKDGVRLAIINFQNEDDWELRDDGWYYFKEALEPGDSTTSLFKSVKLNCSASFGGDNVCHETETGYVCEKPEDRYERAKYHLKITVQTTDDNEGFPEDESCKVTVNPNGGTFMGSTGLYTENVRCGTNFDLSSINYTDHELRDWTLNEQETYTDTNIRINADTDLVANWLSIIKYNVTVDPNGGSYAGSTTPTSYELRKDSIFSLGEATRDGYFVDYWQVVGGERLTSTSFPVTSDLIIQAHWDKAVARIERTGKIYNSIMSAEAEAISNDTITLLVDTFETVTNAKKVTLDLNNHTVIGSLTNEAGGNITLINGEINNPSGAAVTNDGILTIGIDDYKEDGSANILNDNIRLIGTTVGLMQTNDTYHFYFYDVYLEGDLGLVGGYDGAPFYRRTFDGLEIHFFPFVDHMKSGDRSYQHIELKNADRAVTKTSIHGDIYYYNLQDNINTSAVTGYKIYAVRDFEASYPITIAESSNITLDISGYAVSAADTWIINGTFNILDSKPNSAEGIINYSQTMINNGALNLTSAKLATINANTLLRNNKDLTLIGSTLASTSTGYPLEVITDGTALNLDDDSYITGASSYSLYYSATDLEITGGNITSDTSTTIYLEKNSNLVIKGGNISNNSTATKESARAITAYNSSSTLTVDGGIISAYNGSSSCSTIHRVGKLTVNGGTIKAECGGSAQAIETNTDTIINSGNISAISHENRPTTVNCAYGSLTINDGNIAATGLASSYYGAYGISSSSYKILLNNGHINAHSAAGDSIGIYSNLVTVNGGNIEAVSDTGTGYGVKVSSSNTYNTIVTGGKISGSTYGIYGYKTEAVTIGNDDGNISITSPEIIGGSYALYSGSVSFYDGVLKGGVTAYQDGVIVAIPDGATYHIEDIDGLENCWLVQDENYLEVNGVQYNSLIKAFAAANSGDTVKVIASISTEAKMPTNPSGKTIIFDLNGQRLNYTQTIVNEGMLIVKDNSAEQTGVLNNSANSTISNTGGTLQLLSGTISNTSSAQSIQVSQKGTVQIDGGKVSAADYAIYSSGTSNPNATINITAGIIESSNSAIYGNRAAISMTGGKITAVTKGIYYATSIVINGGEIAVDGGKNSTVSGIEDGGNVNFISGKITVNISDYGTANGIYSSTPTISGGEINVTSTQSYAYGVNCYNNNVTMTGGKITASSVSGSAYGIRSGGSSPYTNRGATISGGEISANSETKNSIGVDGGSHHITGGKITGGTYGVQTYASSSTTIGNDDGNISITSPEIIGGSYALYNGSVSFYDGVLKGGVTAYQDGVIVAIPDGATYHIEDIDGFENCWLVQDENYLEVNGVQYNSLIKAFAAANSGDTVKVIASISTEAKMPTNPSGKTIIFDLNGQRLNYTQTIVNEGMLIVKDNSAEQTGVLNNSANSTISNTGGTLQLLSGTISNTSSAQSIQVSQKGTVQIDGGKVSAADYAIYSSGTSNPNATINITAGIIESSDSAIYGNGANISMTGGKITAATNGIYSATSIVIDGGEIAMEGNSNSRVSGIDYGGNVNLISGKITVHSSGSGTATGINYSMPTISGGEINVTSVKGYAYGVDCYNNNVTMTGGKITASSVSNSAYGIVSGSRAYYPNLGATISGGEISASSETKDSVGVDGGSHLITGGKITGGTYGVYTISNTTIGNDDGNISITSPEIIGGGYALYNGSVSFYDGVLKGGVTAYQDGVIKAIAEHATIHISQTQIDDSNYEAVYLIDEYDVAKIGATRYKNLADAITAANNGDTIELIADNYIFFTPTIPADKTVTIDISNYNIIASHPFVNYGTLTLKSTSNNPKTIFYPIASEYFIQNQTDGILTLDNIRFASGSNIIKSSGASLTVINSSLEATTQDGSVINHSSGDLTISNSHISGGTYGVYITSGTNQITDTTITNSNANSSLYAIYISKSSNTTANALNANRGIYNNGGELSIIDSIITENSNRNLYDIINNNSGSVEINNTQITKISNTTGSSSGSSSVIINKGSLSITNNSTITATRYDGYNNIGYSQVYVLNNSGTAIIDSSSLIADFAANTSSNTLAGIFTTGILNFSSSNIDVSYGRNTYGIHNNGGTATIESGTIIARGHAKISNYSSAAYGIYVSGGELTVGKAESSTSPDYGKATANVSVSSPEITGIGSLEGSGIKNPSSRFNFYDGKLIGNTTALPETPTKVEYLYEVGTYTDEETGYEYCILEYMR